MPAGVDVSSCECCGLPVSEWAAPDAYAYTCSYTASQLPHCSSCRVFSAGSLLALGLERMVRGITPVYMRLSSFKGATLILSPGARPKLWAGGKYPEKIPSAVFDVRQLAGGAAYAELLRRPPPEGSLVIDLSLRRERYMRNLKLGRADGFTFCTTEGAYEVPTKGWSEFLPAFSGFKPADKNKALATLRAFVRGEITPGSERIQKFWEDNPKIADAMGLMPIDPHARLFWLTAAGASV